MKIVVSMDVEPDLHTREFNGVVEGIPVFLNLMNKSNIKSTFFTTCDCINKYPIFFKELIFQKHEIALHGFTHNRFDEMSFEEKQNQIKKSISCFKKNLEISPTGFRAPQHSVDKSTLFLLEKTDFQYDSSYTPFNFFQLIFFPRISTLKNFFTPTKKYLIRKNLLEIPTSSFIIPAVSLTFRIFPKPLLRVYSGVLKFLFREVILYFHSWDFIDNKSRISRIFPKERLIKNFEYFLKLNKGAEFVTANTLCEN